MDSGKSTLVAVLTHGADGRPLLDNGRGSARMAVFRHKHEIESGRTSSISQQVRNNQAAAEQGHAVFCQGHAQLTGFFIASFAAAGAAAVAHCGCQVGQHQQSRSTAVLFGSG